MTRVIKNNTCVQNVSMEFFSNRGWVCHHFCRRNQGRHRAWTEPHWVVKVEIMGRVDLFLRALLGIELCTRHNKKSESGACTNFGTLSIRYALNCARSTAKIQSQPSCVRAVSFLSWEKKPSVKISEHFALGVRAPQQQLRVRQDAWVTA